MKLTFSYIPFQWLPSLLICAGYALLQVAVLYPIVSFPFALLLLKCFLDALVFTAIGWLLAVIVPPSSYVKFDAFQRFVNFSALGLLVVLVWVSLFVFTTYIVFGSGAIAGIRHILPLAAFIGILLYVIQLEAIIRRMVIRESEEMDAQDCEEDCVEQSGEEKHREEPAFGDFVKLAEEGVDAAGLQTDNGNPKETVETLERIAVKVGQKIHVIMVSDIIYILSDGDYVQIVTHQNRFLKEETMKFFETGLPRSQFVRVHRSYIVNVEMILRIELYEKQIRLLTLKNGDKIRASASGYKALKNILNL